MDQCNGPLMLVISGYKSKPIFRHRKDGRKGKDWIVIIHVYLGPSVTFFSISSGMKI
jgi:hypothetical protein